MWLRMRWPTGTTSAPTSPVTSPGSTASPTPSSRADRLSRGLRGEASSRSLAPGCTDRGHTRNADRVRTGIGPHDRAEIDDVCVEIRDDRPYAFSQLHPKPGCGCVDNPQVLEVSGGADQIDQRVEALLPTTDA